MNKCRTKNITLGIILSGFLIVFNTWADKPLGESRLSMGLKGSVNFQGAVIPKNEPDFEGKNNFKNWRSANHGGLGIKFSHQIEEKIKVGLSAHFVLGTGYPNSLSTSELYSFLDTYYGNFEFGSRKSAAEGLKVDATNIQAYSTGIDSTWIRNANLNRFIEKDEPYSNTPFYLLPSLYNDYTRTAGIWLRTSSKAGASANDKDKLDAQKISGLPAPKIIYYSPSFNNFKLGISYTRSELAVNNSKSIADYKDVLSGGISYENEILDNVQLKLALTGETATHMDPTNYYNLLGWNLGGQISFAGLKTAASIANIGKSGQLKATKGGDTTYWTLGTAYEIGPTMVSLTYFQSTAESSGEGKKDILNNLSLGSHYHITGKRYKFTPYIGVNFFNTKEADNNKQGNKGHVIFTGIKVTF